MIEFDIVTGPATEQTYKGWVNPARVAWVTDYKVWPNDQYKPQTPRTIISFSEMKKDFLVVKESVESVLTRLSGGSYNTLEGLTSEEIVKKLREETDRGGHRERAV